MGSAKVIYKEIDLSARAPSFPGVYGSIVVQAKKGPVNEPFLVSKDTVFLKKFTPNEKVEVGNSLDHFDALAYLGKSDKLWVIRAAKQAKYGGASIKRSDATTNNQSLVLGFLDPDSYVFDSAPDVIAVAEVTKFTAIADSAASLAGDYFTFKKAPGSLPFYGWFQVNVPAVAEVTSVTCVADVAGSLNNDYFFLNEPGGGNGHYVWYNVATLGVDPGPFGARVGVEVALGTNDSAAAVAVATRAAVDLLAAYSAPVPVGAIVLVTNATAGVVTDSTAETSGFTISVSTQGAAAYVAGVDPAPGGTAVPIVVNQNDTATAVATAAIAALAAHGGSVVSGQPTQFRITNATAGAVTDAAAGTSGFTVLVETQGVDLVNNVDECILIYGSNQGDWNNDIAIKTTRYVTDPDKVKEPDSFLIEVFKSGATVAVESHICSRVQGAKDGYGRNIYVVDVLTASEYIRAIDNLAVTDTIQPKDQATSLSLGGGDDGLAVTDVEMIAAAETMSSPDSYQMTVFMDGGNATVAYGQALDTITSGRQDSVALLSTPIIDEASSNYLTDIIDYRKTELNLNSSYAALFTPHVLIYDKFNDRKIYSSPTGYAGAAISFSAANFEIWFPPAGSKRGIINVLDLRRKFDTGEMDALYDAGINPLRFAPGKGIAIWGQKTLLSRPSALDRLNVRLLLCVIGPAITALLEDFLFDLNDEATRSLATTKVDSYMRGIKARRGVTDFLTVCDNSNNTDSDIDNNRMNLDLFIKPTKSVEEIPFRLVITSTGVSFETAATQI